MRIIQISKFQHVAAHSISEFSLVGAAIVIVTPQSEHRVVYADHVSAAFIEEQYRRFLEWLKDGGVRIECLFAFEEFPDSGVTVEGEV